MSHIRCMYHPRNTFTHQRWARIVEGQSRIVKKDGVSISHIPWCMYLPKGTHLHQRLGPGWLSGRSGWLGMVSPYLTFSACTIQGTHYTKVEPKIVEGLSRIVGVVSHVSFGACTTQGKHLHQGGPG
jgi:hypothetical protein